MPSAPRRTPPRGDTERVEVRVDGRVVLALSPSQRRVRVGLVMPVIERVVDVSVQPAAACRALEEAARRTRVPAGSVEAEARGALDEAARRSSAWRPEPEQCLASAFGGAAFPLLGAAYDEGAEPLHEVPRWAEPVLAAPTIAEGAGRAFGNKATRPVRRALVEAIRPLRSGRVDLSVLALALIAHEVLEPDPLARLLRCDRVAQPAGQLPDPATLRAAREVICDWGPARAERVLCEAAARPEGVSRLFETVGYARQLGDHGPVGAMPNTLDELHDAHRALMRSDAVVPVPAPRPEPAPPPRAAPRCPPHRALPPPVAGRRVGPQTPLVVPDAVRRLDMCGNGELRLVVPRTASDLDRWGRILGNCLGDFGPAAAAGRSVIIGVMRSNRLTYALELTPGGSIRQFAGRGNRRPRDGDRRAVVRWLVEAGVVDAQAGANRQWIADLGRGAPSDWAG